VATCDTHAWVLRRKDLDILLENSSRMRQAIQRWLIRKDVPRYLQIRQKLSSEQADDWIEDAITRLGSKGYLPSLEAIERQADAFCDISSDIKRCSLLADLSIETAEEVASQLLYKRYKHGESFFQRGDPSDRMYIIASGEVGLIHSTDPARQRTILRENDAFGSMAFFTSALHTSSAIATQDTEVWELRRQDLLELVQNVPEFARGMREYLKQPDVAAYLENRHGLDTDKVMRWIQTAVKDIDIGKLTPAVAEEIEERLAALKGAPLAIYLGIFLDGIPESLVIGASFAFHEVSLALIAGLFLSNYPEALFSSIGMQQQGFSVTRIITMWTSLMLLTGLGAAVGSLMFVGAGGHSLAFIEGLAAGAMLTMIAQTMLPDAYFKGGSVIGLATLMGFLVALFFKSF
jgi:CRP-like cAMP-binding protein